MKKNAENKIVYANLDEYKASLIASLMSEEEADELIARIGKDVHDVEINADGTVTEWIL